MVEYRMLKEGEVIQEGDEHWCSFLREWCRTYNAERTVSKYTVGCYRRTIETKKGTGMFVEEVKTKRIKSVVDGRLSSGAMVSVEGPDADGLIRLVVGAFWSHREACYLDKESMTELIDNLTEVRDLMEGED